MTRSAAPLDHLISDSLNAEDAQLMRELLPEKGRRLELSEHHLEQLLGPRDAPKVMPEPLLRALELAAARTGGTPWSETVAFMVLAVTIGLTTSVSVAAVGERGSALLLGAITCVMLVALAVMVLVRQSSASHRERVIHRLQVRRLDD